MRSLVRATRGFLLFFCFCDMMIASPYVAIADEDITVAVSDFTNSTGRFRYDEFEKSIPEMLKTDLSRIGDIVVVERSKLEAILQEQAESDADGTYLLQFPAISGAIVNGPTKPAPKKPDLEVVATNPSAEKKTERKGKLRVIK